MLERSLPHNLDIERCVLGAILLDQPQLAVVQGAGLVEEDFFLDQHRRVYRAALAVEAAHGPVDLMTVADYLLREGQLEAAGGNGYLSSLLDGIPKIVNVAHYAGMVRERSLLRKIAACTEAIHEQALAAEEDADEVLSRAESSIFALAEERIRTGFVGASEVVSGYYPTIERMVDGGQQVTGLATGYARLDELTLGLQDSELIVLAARPSIGKTALALNMAENIAIRAEEPRTVGIFSLEMSKEALLLRLLAANAPVNAHALRAGQCDKPAAQRIGAALKRIADAPLWIDDAGSATVMELAAKARRLKHERGLSLVIVDYLQLLTHKTRFANRVEQVTEISRALKAMAKELRVPVLALSQLTRAPEREDRRPMLSDLRDSGSIEQDADVVMFIHRPKMYEKGASEDERRQAELIVAKQRNGPVEDVNLVFFETHTRFEEAAGF